MDHHNAVLHHTGGGPDGGENEGEKKSVLKKVKAKAKKIKETITGHGHGHDHDHDEDDYVDEMDTDPDTHGGPTAARGINVGKEGITKHHGTNIGTHALVADPGAHQVCDPTTTHYVPGQEETLSWSRTDTRTQLGSENQSHALRHTPAIAQSTGSHRTGDIGAVHKPKLGGILEKDSHVLKHVGDDVHPADYQAKSGDATPGGYASTAIQDIGLGHGTGTARQHREYVGKGSSIDEASHVPVSKPMECQTFDTTASKYIPGQDETLGWSRTDTGRSTLSEEQPYAPRNTPIVAHPGHRRGGVLEPGEMRESGKHEVILDRPTHLEKDPRAPRDVGETCHAENYQTKVADPTGWGSEEIGVTPILHQVGKMNINDDSNVNKTGQQEHLSIPSSFSPEMASTGSHDQFSPESVPNPQFDSTRASGHGFPNEVGQRPESYTEKISSVASELASKAKLATGSVASKLGYGGSHESPTNNDSDVPGGHEESLSSISSPITDSKSGYGVGEEQSTVGSIGDYGKKAVSTVQEKITPVFEKVVRLGSTVASKGQGSGPECEVTSTGRVPDKGVSVKEYLAQKLQPGEEDKALSKVITEALPLHKPKENPIAIENPINVGCGDEVRNDEMKRQASESDQAKKVVITGRVAESEEVANRLGRSEDTDYDGAGAGLASPGKSVMDRIRDAAGSWFNKSGEPLNQPDDHPEAGAERTQTSNAGDTQLNQNVGETGLQ